MSDVDWRDVRVAEDGTHHTCWGHALYERRFEEVQKFHAPGLAPARDSSGAYHIGLFGSAAYSRRYLRTFGFYEGLAAVVSDGGWMHVLVDGAPAYSERWAWAGNFHEHRCPVRDQHGQYVHIDPAGTGISPRPWRYAGDYRDGVAVVQDEGGASTHVDPEGRLLHGRWFHDLDVFHKGLARARDEYGWTHVDRTGTPAYTRRFASVEPFYNGQARVERFDGGLEVIDPRGEAQVELRPAPRGDPVEGRTLARTAWGRVVLVESDREPAFVLKGTRGNHDREVEVLLELRGHPGAPALRGRRRTDPIDWIRLEALPGGVVGEPRRLRPHPVHEAVQVTVDVLRVCEELHHLGWVHTDIHPGNVLAGTPAVLIDYACAVRACYGNPWRGEMNWGVWEYAPPEQLADFAEIDPSADVYAAASLCVAMVRGGPPVRIDVRRVRASGGWPAVREAIREAGVAPALTEIPESLRAVLAPALARECSMRPTARALREALSRG